MRGYCSEQSAAKFWLMCIPVYMYTMKNAHLQFLIFNLLRDLNPGHHQGVLNSKSVFALDGYGVGGSDKCQKLSAEVEQ